MPEVDTNSLKKELTSYMDTGYSGDTDMLVEILAMIDRHTKPFYHALGES